MTRRELTEALARFKDDQYVFVNLRSDAYPAGSQLIIQGVTPVPPWYGQPGGSTDLVGLDVHAGNQESVDVHAAPDNDDPGSGFVRHGYGQP